MSEVFMEDVIYILIGLGFFAASFGLVYAFEALRSKP
jgi:hypothetical protein